MKKDLRDKLKAYSIAAGAVAAASSGQGQVLYTNIEPDTLTSGLNGSYELDLNNDNITDFIFNINQSTNSGSFTFTSGFFNYFNINTGVSITPEPGNAILGNWAVALDSGMIVQNGAYLWSGYGQNNLANQNVYNSSYQIASYYGGTYSGQWSGTWSQGNFINAQDKYVGLRVEIGGELHYGWARIDVNSFTEFVVKDYAIEMTPNKFIITGDTGLITNASEAMDVQASDVADQGNGNDIVVEFAQGTDESTVLLYNIIIVKESAASSFDLAAAQAVSSSSYFPVVPSGSATYSQPLHSNLRDSDGDLITVDIPYVAFIHTIANSNVAINDALSSPSNAIELEKALGVGELNADLMRMSQGSEGVEITALNGNRFAQVHVFDMNGREAMNAQSNVDMVQLRKSELASGMYVVRIVTEKETSILKVVLD